MALRFVCLGISLAGRMERRAICFVFLVILAFAVALRVLCFRFRFLNLRSRASRVLVFRVSVIGVN